MIETWRRRNEGLLSRFEAPALRWLAARTPGSLSPDMLTAIGLLGAVIAFFAYAFSGSQPVFLWLASLGLVVNWLGDSLDGTVARFRKIERPRYGFFLDNAVDIVEQALLAIGIALSGYVRVDLSLLALAAFLMLSMLSLLRASVTDDFRMAYAGFGITELRVGFVLINTLMFFVPPKPLFEMGIEWTYPNLVSIAWSVTMVLVFAGTLLTDLRQLAASDPRPTKGDGL